MGAAGPLPLDETVEHRNGNHEYGSIESTGHSRWNGWIVVFAASLVFLVSILAPPRLVDDVDAVQATIARNMLTSGDWVTARLDGVAYLEKSPLIYWMMAVTYEVLGVHDWAARLPLARAVSASTDMGKNFHNAISESRPADPQSSLL